MQVVTNTQLRSLIRETLLLELRNTPNGPVPSDTKYYARPVAGGYVLYYAVGPKGKPTPIPETTTDYYQRVAGKDYDLTPDQIQKAEELTNLGIFSKSSVEEKYKDSTFKWRKNVPGTLSAQWKTEADVPDTATSYGPAGGDYFEYLLVDTENKLVDLAAGWTGYQSRRGASTPSKTVKDKSYVIPSGDVAFVGKETSFKKLLTHLMQADPRVTPDYKILSPDDKYEGQTIGQTSSAPRTTDVATGGAKGTITAYHGTSDIRWKDIEKKGMLPGKFEEAYADQIAGYSSKNVYFTMDPVKAENYATRASIWYGGNPLILKVEIPDISRIIPDEDRMGWFKLRREYNLKRTDGVDSWGGGYDAEKGGWQTVIKPREGQVLAGEQHPKNIIGFLRYANQSKAYGKYEEEAPEAGPEWVKDDEYYALLKDVEQGMAGFLAKSVGGGTFAYRGWIPPKFIKKWKTYPKKPYPRSVDTGRGGSDDDYEKTRQSVLKKMKRFDKNESLVRSLVRSMLTEALAPNFASSVTHSAGWISPTGDYFYDPNKRDHGEWAAFQAEKDPKLMATFLEELKKDTDPLPPPPPRTPAEQAVYDAKSPMGKKMDDWKRQGGRPLEGKAIPPYKNMGELYYSDLQSEVRSAAQRALLTHGWGKVSNAYGIEVWKPSRSVLETWMNLGMDAGSDPEVYHNVYDKNGSLAEGGWDQIERFMRRLS